jgi:hypothetical protein
LYAEAGTVNWFDGSEYKPFFNLAAWALTAGYRDSFTFLTMQLG